MLNTNNRIRTSVFLLILGTIFLINCNNSQTRTNRENGRTELVPEPDRHYRLLFEAMQKLKKTNCVFSKPDTSLCGITLSDAANVNTVIGANNIVGKEEKYHFYSKTNNETLTLTPHQEDGKSQIVVIKVTYSDTINHHYKQLNFGTFETEKGIKLGMTQEELTRLLGNCYAVVDSTKDFIELYYRIENARNNKTEISKNHKEWAYYAIYGFWKNRLQTFEFGFNYRYITI